MSDEIDYPLRLVKHPDGRMEWKDDAPSELPAPAGSVELPREDGYYWMKNIAGEEAYNNVRVVWRVVNVFNAAERGQKKRVARDGCSLYTSEYLTDWKGVEFHGPLVPPNSDSATARPVA